METPKIKNEAPQQEVSPPESRKMVSGAFELVKQFFELKNLHEPLKKSMAKVASRYSLPKSDYKDVAKEVLEQLEALDVRETKIIEEAKIKAEAYTKGLNELQNNLG
jgi:hypothetical protein